jgi:hypothetical protein
MRLKTKGMPHLGVLAPMRIGFFNEKARDGEGFGPFDDAAPDGKPPGAASWRFGV